MNKDKYKWKAVNIKRKVFIIIALFIYMGLTFISGNQSLSLFLKAGSFPNGYKIPGDEL